MDSRDGPHKVLIAGGGVAGLEAALALADLAGPRVDVTMLAPEPEFVYRPLRVQEPFGGPLARHYALKDVANHIGMELRKDAFKWLDPERRIVHTEAGDELGYDSLLLALGARLNARFKHAVTLDDRHLDEQLRGLLQDVEGGYVHKIAFVAPSRMAWPLPLYELALMTARRAYDVNEDVSVTIVTAEDAPLAVFGATVSETVAELLERNGILTICSTHAETPEPGSVALHPGERRLHVDRVVALPELFGPATPGVPKHDGHGFISVDAHCKVDRLDDVFAAGDATDFPVKFGGIAAQQADVAAEAIAARAGAPIEPSKFYPLVHGMLLGGDRPLYLSAHITGGHGSSSEVSDQPPSDSASKIAAKYLTPYLEARDRSGVA